MKKCYWICPLCGKIKHNERDWSIQGHLKEVHGVLDGLEKNVLIYQGAKTAYKLR